MAFPTPAGNVAEPQTSTLRIPAVKIPLTVKDQTVTILVSALLSTISTDRDLTIFKLELTANLSELQENITPLLSAELDKDDKCGERMTIQNATLVPAAR